MEIKTALQPRSHEQRLISIVRKLPAGRVSQVIDFARFIEWQVSDIVIQKSFFFLSF